MAQRIRTPSEKCVDCGQACWGRTRHGKQAEPRCRVCANARRARQPRPKRTTAVERTCHEPGCERRTCGRHNSRCSACHYKWQRDTRRRFHYECLMCGSKVSVYRKARSTETFCGRGCATTYKNWIRYGHTPSRSRELVHMPRPPRVVTVEHTRSTTVMHCGTCTECGKTYTAHTQTRACSASCQEVRAVRLRRAKAQRRRARKRCAHVEHFTAQEIHVRDGYRCHICRRKTQPRAHFLDPSYPTVDHLIPLALGGPHTKANVATACRICNSSKSHHGAGDQLALI